MPDPANTRIVANSLVLGEIAAQVGEALSATRSEDGATLLSTIRRHKHLICTTGNIDREYAKAESSGQYPHLRGILTPALRQLRIIGVLKSVKTGPMPEQQMLAGFGKAHVAFLQDAARVDAKYLLTANPRWLEKGAVGGVQILRSSRYVELQES